MTTHRLIHLALVTLLTLGASAACEDDAEQAPSDEAAEQTAEETAEAESEEAESEESPLEGMRQAYGLPFPPEVEYIKKGPNFVEVGTSLYLDELERYFKGRLVDYEFIRPDSRSLRIVGLRDYMPSIWIYYNSASIPRVVRYVQPAPPPGKAAPGGLEVAQADGDESSDDGTTTRRKPRKGDPVNIKLPDGSPLAPGARWGESYTPPPESPLHQERFRANFGKPFGEWIPN